MAYKTIQTTYGLGRMPTSTIAMIGQTLRRLDLNF